MRRTVLMVLLIASLALGALATCVGDGRRDYDDSSSDSDSDTDGDSDGDSDSDADGGQDGG